MLEERLTNLSIMCKISETLQKFDFEDVIADFSQKKPWKRPKTTVIFIYTRHNCLNNFVSF